MKVLEMIKSALEKTPDSIFEKLSQNNDKLVVYKGFGPDEYDFTTTCGNKKALGKVVLKDGKWVVKKL